MAPAQNRLVGGVRGKLRTKVGVRLTRFIGVAVASLAATEIALTICNGAFHMTSTPSAVVAWFVGAVVSYVLSRWAWERKGKPDLLRETLPFWLISALVLVLLTLANKFGYDSAAWLGLQRHGIKHILWVDFVWLVANFVTFVLRFVIFQYVLFTDRMTAARPAAAAGPDASPPVTSPPVTSEAPAPAAATHSAAQGAASASADMPQKASPAAPAAERAAAE
jgi:putative flippase GtrA